MLRQMVFFFVFIGLLFSCSSDESADLILYHGNFILYTNSSDSPEAIAIREGEIVQIGDSSRIFKLKDSHTKVVDLKGKTVISGFIEGHGHFLSMGLNLSRVLLDDVKNYKELVEKVKQAARQAAPGEWIIGRGWHQNKWLERPSKMVKGFPTHELLSKAVPNHPVYLIHASGHAILVNQKAMELAGIQDTTSSPEGGEIIRDPNGHPTGVFVENAEQLIARVLPPITEEKKKKAILLAQKECFKNGITMFHDAGASMKTIQLYKKLYAQGLLKIRLYVMLNGNDSLLLRHYFAKGPEIGLFNDHLNIRSVKLYIDGALGSRGAWLLEPYNDRPGFTGAPVTPLSILEQISNQAAQHHFQVCTHAIGDRANREILNIYEKVLNKSGNPFSHRFRVEHAQHIHPDDIPRFASSGIIASMQAIHFASDIDWAIDRLGKERIMHGSYAWKSLWKSGAIVMNGTDVPVEPVNPLPNYYTMVTRKNRKGELKSWYNPSEKLSRIEALKAYTINNAYGAFMENQCGSIAVGKYADFTVLSRDITRIPEDSILTTHIVYTIINGEIVYQRNNGNE